MTFASRLRAAIRYFRSLKREPVSAQTYKLRKRETTAKLRREVVERQLVAAVEKAVMR